MQVNTQEIILFNEEASGAIVTSPSRYSKHHSKRSNRRKQSMQNDRAKVKKDRNQSAVLPHLENNQYPPLYS